MAEYIERDALLKKALAEIKEFEGVPINRLRELAEADKDGCVIVTDAPLTADAVPVVRCKDCVWCEDQGMSGLYCNHPDNRNPCGCRPNDFCNDGERKEATP